MNKQILTTLGGAVILFIWQFLSWAALPVHQSSYGYTANQDQIMACLNQYITEPGTYMLPGSPPGTSHEQAEKDMQNDIGKPWASISYHKSFDMSMGMNMARGFSIDLIAMFLLIWLLSQFRQVNIRNSIMSAVAIGCIGYLTIPYLYSIWFEESSVGYLFDAIVPWVFIGAWLGWRMKTEG